MINLFSDRAAKFFENFFHLLSLVKSVQAVGDYSEGFCDGQYDNSTNELFCRNGLSILSGDFTVGFISLARYNPYGFLFVPTGNYHPVIKYTISTIATSIAVRLTQFIGDKTEELCDIIVDDDDEKALEACETGLALPLGMAASVIIGIIGYKIIGFDLPHN